MTTSSMLKAGLLTAIGLPILIIAFGWGGGQLFGSAIGKQQFIALSAAILLSAPFINKLLLGIRMLVILLYALIICDALL